MGVVYKLTEDVVRFIVDRKDAEPRLSCREIADLVAGQYQRVVSKSSVHDVLKEHGVVIPRGRKPKLAKFQIPLEKKQQLFANVPAIVVPQAAASTPQVSFLKVSVGNPENGPPTKDTCLPAGRFGGDRVERAGEVFIQAVFWDIFPRPLWGLKKWKDIKSLNMNDLRREWAYVTTPVERFKVDLEDGSFFEVDSRFQCLDNTILASPLAPPVAGQASIERSTQEAADCFLNNIKINA